MAQSPKTTILNPVRAWSAFAVGAVVLMTWSAYGIYSVNRDKSAELAAAQLDIMIRSRYQDLVSGKYRDFVEGAGREYPDLKILISGAGNRFTFGAKEITDTCRTQQIPSPQEGTVTIELCRPGDLPVLSLAGLAAVLMTAMILGLVYILWLEKSAAKNLLAIFETLGVRVRHLGGLTALLARVGEIIQDLQVERARALELSRYQALGELAAEVAHDIRSPIAAIRGLSATWDTHLAGRHALDSAIGRLEEITRDLLGRYRNLLHPTQAVTTSSAPVDHDPQAIKSHPLVDAAMLLQEVVNELNMALSAGNGSNPGRSGALRFVWASNPEILIVGGDPAALRRAFANLLNNAVEACGGEPAKVETTIARKNDLVEIRISDKGSGMSPDVLARLGEKGGTFGKPGGTGLGVHTARRAIEDASGRLSYESEPGLGTTATAHLKLVDFEDFARPPVTVVVDDDIWIREAWELAGQRAGRSVLTFADQVNLSAGTADLPANALFFVDVDLGDAGSGTSVVPMLRERSYSRIYFSTGHDRSTLSAQDLAGVIGIIGKEPPHWWHRGELPTAPS